MFKLFRVLVIGIELCFDILTNWHNANLNRLLQKMTLKNVINNCVFLCCRNDAETLPRYSSGKSI